MNLLFSFLIFKFRLCRHVDTILLTTLTAPVSSLREKLLKIIHRLLSEWNKFPFSLFLNTDIVTGIIAGLCVGLSVLTWLATTKRQISRINILLFRSLLQRVSLLWFFAYHKIYFQFLILFLISHRGKTLIKSHTHF